MAQIQAYLKFSGNCKEAMNFYKEVLGGELNMMPFSEAPHSEQMSEAERKKIMHASLATKEFTLMAADMSQEAETSTRVVLSLNCVDEDETQRLFKALSQGATIQSPLKKEFWGDLFGMLTDRFGIEWMLNCGHN